MFEDYYFDDPALQGLLAAAAGPIMDTPRQAAVMPMTTEVAPYDLSSLYGMNFGSDFGSGGAGGGIYPTNPDLQMHQAPLSSKGNPTAYGGNYIQVTSPTQDFRLVDKNTGKVVYEGTGYEGAQEAIDRASALTAEKGAKAQWQIQTPNPQQPSGYSIVANEKRNQSTVGDIASVALPVGMALLTGGMSLPAQMAAAGIAGAAGAGLAGKNPATAGLLSAATAGIMGGTGANDAIGRAVSDFGGTLAGKTAEEVTKQVAKTAAEKAAEKVSEQIVVTALSKAAQGAGSAIGNTLLSQGIKGGLSEITGYKTPAEKFAEQPLPEASEPSAVDSAGFSDGYVDPQTGEIVVSKYRPINPSGGFNPVAVATAAGLPIGSLLDSLGPLNTLPSDPALMQPETLPEDIVVTAPIGVTPETGLPVGPLLPTLGIPQVPTPDPALTDKGGVLGTGLNLPQLISIGGIGADLLKNLLAGGGDTGAGTPYVSPFGTGVGFARGQDMRANPNITDYERYGFGPEAMFFRPEYSGLLSSAAPAPQAQPAMAINPVYQPLI